MRGQVTRWREGNLPTRYVLVTPCRRNTRTEERMKCPIVVAHGHVSWATHVCNSRRAPNISGPSFCGFCVWQDDGLGCTAGGYWISRTGVRPVKPALSDQGLVCTGFSHGGGCVLVRVCHSPLSSKRRCVLFLAVLHPPLGDITCVL